MMMNGKGFSRKRSWPNLRYYAGIRLQKLKKTTKILITVAGAETGTLNTKQEF
jgi:hypothetical protein